MRSRIATCNHWHSLITIWACQAGKHVYVEKPFSHNIFEGRKCVEAARKYERIVQHGTQQRSSAEPRQRDGGRSSRQVRQTAGRQGLLLQAALDHRLQSRSRTAAQDFDFNLWLGPAPEQPLPRQPGPLQLALVLGLRQRRHRQPGRARDGRRPMGHCGATLPKASGAWAAASVPRATRTRPDAQHANCPSSTTATSCSSSKHADWSRKSELRRRRVRERVLHDRRRDPPDGKFYPKNGGDAVKIEAEASVAPGGPFGSFIAAVRSRDETQINGDVETAHYSAALCHLGNVSYRLGKPASFDGKPDVLGDNAQVVEAFNNVVDNLKAVDVVMDDTATYQMGPMLSFDPIQEKFIDNDEANQLLTRPYRAPFVVPKDV